MKPRSDFYVTDHDFMGGGDIASTTHGEAAQMAINFAMYGDGAKYNRQNSQVRLLGDKNGRVDLEQGLHAGHEGFMRPPTIRGQGPKIDNEGVNCGTALICHFTDEPAISFHGARSVDIGDLHIQGGHTSFATSDTRDPSTWATNGQHNPHAGIAFGPMSGDRPTTGYPLFTVPDFIHSSEQGGYKDDPSVLAVDEPCSDFRVQNVSFRYLDTAIAAGPCDFVGNDDFLTAERIYARDCAAVASFGAAQGRRAMIRGVNARHVLTGITGVTHGKKNGRIGGHLDGMAFFDVGTILDLTTLDINGGMTVTALDAEEVYRLLRVKGGDRGSITIIEPRVSYKWVTGRPNAVIEGRGKYRLKIIGGVFENHDGACVVMAPNASFDGLEVRPKAGTLSAHVHDYLSGGIFQPEPRPQVVQYETSAGLDTSTDPLEHPSVTGKRPAMLWDRGEDAKAKAVYRNAADMGATLSGDILTFSALPPQYVAGDLIHVEAKGPLFEVLTSTTARALTGTNFDPATEYYKLTRTQ